MTDDEQESDFISAAVGEIDTAQNQSTLESYRASLQGWRRTAGTTLGFAVFVDLMFVMAGSWLIANTSGWTVIAGIVTALVGVLGLAEKAYRRVA